MVTRCPVAFPDVQVLTFFGAEEHAQLLRPFNLRLPY